VGRVEALRDSGGSSSFRVKFRPDCRLAARVPLRDRVAAQALQQV
jgi:hypothetical protein